MGNNSARLPADPPAGTEVSGLAPGGITRRTLTAALATLGGALSFEKAVAFKAAQAVSVPDRIELPEGSDKAGAQYLDLVKQTVTMDAREFGAQGDGFEHPLSEYFGSLSAAQAEFPDATSLQNLIDGLAIQKALTAIKSTRHERGRLRLGTGRYRGNTGSIKLPNFVEIVGEGPGITVIDNQNTLANYPLIVNDNPDSLIYSTLRELSLHGGFRAIDINVTAETAGFTLDSVGMALQAMGNMRCNKLLQLALFDKSTFGDAPWGLEVPSFTTNAVDFRSARFENHTVCSLRLRSAESVNFTGGRFEGGGRVPASVTGSIADTILTVTAAASATLQIGDELIGAGIAAETRIIALQSGKGGVGTYIVAPAHALSSRAISTFKASIDIDNAKAVNIDGVYFEATHKTLLRETNSRNGFTFRGCHFTGAKEGNDPFQEYRFDSVGLITFENNNFGLPTEGPGKMLVIGPNKNLGFNSDMILALTERGGKMVSKRREFAGTIAYDALKFSRSADAGNQSLTGVLRITMTGQTAAGGVARVRVEEYAITISANKGYPMQIQSDAGRVIDQDMSGFDMIIANEAATHVQTLLRIGCTGGNAAGQSHVYASFEYELGNSAPSDQIAVDFV